MNTVLKEWMFLFIGAGVGLVITGIILLLQETFSLVDEIFIIISFGILMVSIGILFYFSIRNKEECEKQLKEERQKLGKIYRPLRDHFKVEYINQLYSSRKPNGGYPEIFGLLYSAKRELETMEYSKKDFKLLKWITEKCSHHEYLLIDEDWYEEIHFKESPKKRINRSKIMSDRKKIEEKLSKEIEEKTMGYNFRMFKWEILPLKEEK